MSPETIKKLREQNPEFQELLDYLSQKAHEINTLEGMEKMSFTERAYEAGVRVKTHARIMDILGPLLKDNSGLGASDPADFVV